MAEHRRRRKWRIGACVLVVAGVIAAAITTDVKAHDRARREQQQLVDTQNVVAHARFLVDSATYARGLYQSKLRGLQHSLENTINQLGTSQQSLSASNKSAYLQGLDIGTLHTCLGGVQNALAQIQAGDNNAATDDISGVSGACLSLESVGAGGPVYPFDFPDPFVLRVGSTYYAYATNSAEGNIQIIQSSNLTQWTGVGNALPKLPAWAKAGGTWAPSVLQDGNTFLLYYAAVVGGKGGGEECISVATAGTPVGPFIDHSSAPLECQTTQGGSIDPSTFVDTNGTPYLIWKSNGQAGQPATLWSEMLDAAGTGFAADTPTLLLTPNNAWEKGTVEAPDMESVNGRDYLFFSGNSWNTANYAVGLTICSGPLGPCNQDVPSPMLASGSTMSGPGGESLFTDGSGNLWMAFDAWLPGGVGYPHSRALYIRQLNYNGQTLVVGTAP
jgi:hypothetical protein